MNENIKYIARLIEDGDEYYWEIELDDPNYDGPVTNIHDPEGVYHIEAENIQEAEKIADWELEIDWG